MGMVGRLQQISPERLSEFIRDPQIAYEYIRASDRQHTSAMIDQIMDDPEKFVAGLGLGKPRDISAAEKEQFKQELKQRHEQFMSALDSIRAKRQTGPQLVKKDKRTSPEEPIKIFSMEKDWHILHYILNGTAEGGGGPLAYVVLGGTELPDREGIMSYGPARYLTPEQVKAAASALAAADSAALAKRFDVRDANAKRIYGLAYAGGPTTISPEEVMGFVEPVRDFYTEASHDGNAMLFYLS